MHKNQSNKRKKQLTLKIPIEILAEQELSLKEKYLLGLDYNLLEKQGFNNYTNKAVEQILHLHRNLVCKARKQLVNKGFLSKEKRTYRLTDLALNYLNQNNSMIYIFAWVYQNDNLCVGAKLLYGEYNSMCNTHGKYFAKRENTAKKLAVSIKSISKWTKQLDQKGCLEQYYHNRGYCSNQTVIKTASRPIVNLNFKFSDKS